MSSTMIDVACEFKRENETSIAVWDGNTEEVQCRRTGEMITREIWHWVPKKLCHYDTRTKKLWLPEWLAQKRGMI